MLARSLTRVSVRPGFCHTAVATRATRAAFKSLAKDEGPEVPVISYEGGHRHEEILSVPVSKDPVMPAGQDEQKKAYALAANAYKYLTPTLSRFTLPDKIAVITGYASSTTQR